MLHCALVVTRTLMVFKKSTIIMSALGCTIAASLLLLQWLLQIFTRFREKILSLGSLKCLIIYSLTVLNPTTQPYRPSSKRPSMNFFHLNEWFGIIDECVSIFQKSLRAKRG